MKIVVPYTDDCLRQETTRAVGPGAIFEHIDPEDPDAYWSILCRHWREGETFLIFEHDVVPTVPQMMEMLSCDEPLCCIPSRSRDGSMGCGMPQKYDAALMRRYPNLVESIADIHVYPWGLSPTHWWNLHPHMNRRLEEAGVVLHEHAGEMVHLSAGAGRHPHQP